MQASAARWIAPANYHLTLVFLGANREDSLPALRERLSPVVAGFRPFRYALRGPVLFPDAGKPRVLALLPEDPLPFADWQTAVAAVCGALDFTLESRPFRPHLSLARIRRPGPAGLPAVKPGLEGVAEQVRLYRSEGGVYTPLFTLACAA